STPAPAGPHGPGAAPSDARPPAVAGETPAPPPGGWPDPAVLSRALPEPHSPRTAARHLDHGSGYKDETMLLPTRAGRQIAPDHPVPAGQNDRNLPAAPAAGKPA